MSGMEIPAAVAIGSSVIGAGTSIYGSMKSAEAQEAGKVASAASSHAQLMAAQEQAAAFEFEGRQYDRQGKQIRAAASSDEASRRDSLASSLETIDVLRAGRGLDPDSPTGRAIMSGITSTAEKNIETSKSNFALQSVNAELAGELSRRKARYSLLAGEAGAAAGAAGQRAADANIDATIAGGFGRVAGIGMDLTKTLRYGGTGFGSVGSGSP